MCSTHVAQKRRVTSSRNTTKYAEIEEQSATKCRLDEQNQQPSAASDDPNQLTRLTSKRRMLERRDVCIYTGIAISGFGGTGEGGIHPEGGE